MKRKFKIQVIRNSRNRWFWRIKSTNGKTLCHSENYNTKSAALNTVKTLKENLKNSILEILEENPSS